EGLRRLLGFAEREGLRDRVVSALRQTRTVIRGPKPVQALREIGLTPSVIAPAPTTEGVIASLRAEPLARRAVGGELYSDDNPPLMRFLEESGAVVRPVLPYVYAPAADAERVADLIGQLAEGSVHAIIFTSSPQVDRLFEVATERGLVETLKQGLER